MLLNNNTCN